MAAGKPLLVMFIAVLSIASCNEGKMKSAATESTAMVGLSESSMEKLAGQTFFFAHQSVGLNIVEGIQKLHHKYQEQGLNISAGSAPDSWESGQFIHANVGRNKDPKSKMDEFARLMTGARSGTIDTAALKFCYADINRRTDIEAVLAEYTGMVNKIRRANPGLTILHFTVPLRTTHITWKAWIKKQILRRNEVWEYNELTDNISRNRYNDLVLERFGAREPVFDLAKIQSTFPDGSHCSFTWEGETYNALVPDYSSDGGHLNEAGSVAVAREFLACLASLE